MDDSGEDRVEGKGPALFLENGERQIFQDQDGCARDNHRARFVDWLIDLSGDLLPLTDLAVLAMRQIL